MLSFLGTFINFETNSKKESTSFTAGQREYYNHNFSYMLCETGLF